MSEAEEPEERTFELVMSYYIDTDGYTDRDREMFVCGAEYQMIMMAIAKAEGWSQAIHNENVSRTRMMCGKFKVPFKITPHGSEWSILEIPPIQPQIVVE